MTRTNFQFLTSILLTTLLIVTGCTNSESMPVPTGAEALSMHYVMVSLAQPAGLEAELPSNYEIRDANGQPLSVNGASLSDDGLTVLLMTSAQDDMSYQLMSMGGGGPAVEFMGSSQVEPALLSAIALDNATVLLTFSEDMDSDTAENHLYYEIADPDGDTDVDISITAAAMGDEDYHVLLTTTPQENIQYAIKVTNVQSNSGKFIDPTHSSDTFFGMPAVDNIPPTVTEVLSLNDTTLLVSFSEPLDNTAGDPVNFSISPDLAISGAVLSAYNTQVLLTTQPQNVDVVYTVTVENVHDKAGNLIDAGGNSATVSYVGAALLAGSELLPRVVGAAATSNTTVVVTFNRAMGDSALEASNYFIVQENVHPEAGALTIVDDPMDPSDDPVFLNSLRASVQLTTLPQNEVTYVVTVFNVMDLSGNALAPKSPLVDPTSAVFAGSPFSCGGGPCTLPDSDGDGLPDTTEQRGWIVTVELINGQFTQRDVSSDPFSVDTDGDGLTDDTELSLVTDPRSADTDGDKLNDYDEFNVFYSEPASQDTDGDGLSDDIEVQFYRTSPILADTDGDGFDDAEELLERNRNPRVADLPRPAFTVGNMRMQIDERYTTTTEDGEVVTMDSSSSTTMAQSEDTTFASSETDLTSNSRDTFVQGGLELEFSKSLVPDVTVSAEAGVTWKQHDEHTTQFSEESTSSAQQVYEASLSKGSELSTTTAVTREVVDARVDVDLTITNAGDIAFSLSNIEISMLQSTGLSNTDFEPIGTLIANTALITGDQPTFNLGPFTEELGPLVFANRDIFPNEVDSLLAEPRGLIFSVVNYDITDEFGRNFAFASQSARDRTAGLTIDYGDGTVDRFLVATAGAFDVDNIVGGGFVGGFDGNNGEPIGLPLDFILQDTLNMTKNATTPDAILAGGNLEADSFADGDDIQLIPQGTTGLTDDAIVISAGANGVLDSTASGDDEEAVTTGYATSPTCSVDTDQIFDANDPDILLNGPGFACETDSDCPGAGTCTGREVLVRMRNRRLGDFNRVWAVFDSGLIPAGANFGDIVMLPGDDITMAFIQDLDRDGLFANEEYLYGSSDKDKDTDGEGIGDFAEVRVGWDVGVTGTDIREVLPDPRVSDSDGDGLTDTEEQDLRLLWCRCDGGDDDGAACGDSGVCGDGTCLCQLAAYTCNGGDDDGLPCSGDDSCASPGTCAGNSGPEFADVFNGASPTDGPMRSDPRNPDTDGDGVNDMDEIGGYLIGVSVRDPNPSTGTSQTQALSDDVQKVFVGQPVGPSGVLILPGPNGDIDSACDLGDLTCGPSNDQVCCGAGDDYLFPGVNVVTNLLDPDHDGDTRIDGDERDGGSDPTNANDSDDFIDSDRDGMSDAAEEDVGWTVPGVGQVFSSKFVGDTDFDGLPDLLEREITTDPTRKDTDNDGLDDYDEFINFSGYLNLTLLFPGFVLDGTDSLLIGSDPLDTDTDDDGLDDLFEATSGWTVIVNGQVYDVTSDPLRYDTDLDGLNDQEEMNTGTDPRNPDTDGDGAFDGNETVSDPLVPDLVVEVALTQASWDNEDYGSRDWTLRIRTGLINGSETNLFDGEDLADCKGFSQDTDCGSFGGAVELPSDNYNTNGLPLCSAVTTYSMQAGDVLLIRSDTVNMDCSDESSNCVGKAVDALSFDDLLSNPWQQLEVDMSLNGVPGFDPCTSEFVFEITRL